MKQLIQHLDSGKTALEEVPVPAITSRQVLVRARCSLVSKGTEKSLVDFGQASLLNKARKQPERVKQVVQKMKTDGVQPALNAVFRKLGTPLPLGYSMAGEVIEAGSEVHDFKPGDRVISNGAHAEYVAVPKNLVARIPDHVSYEEAAFTVVGSIGLQGVRLIHPTFGESVAVIGLGLIGLITIQLLKANGCKVIGFDLDESKLQLARKLGVEAVHSGSQDPVEYIQEYTSGNGADAVLITASTQSNAVIKQAARMSRKRGRIVLVGVIGLDIDRSDFYEKELTFQVSCSYGPGRYDEEYEQKGHDYPLPFVRWTEKRNFEAVLEAISNGSLNVKPLITERVKLDDYLDIYEDMDGGDSIASIIEYPVSNIEYSAFDSRTITVPDVSYQPSNGGMAIVGAGTFTQATLLPALKKAGAPVKYIVSSGGLSSTTLAKKYQIPNSTTDLDSVLADDEVEGVLITTRHNLHAAMTVRALKAGKQVFVEKPLALNSGELTNIITAVQETGNTVNVGFNRRFSPHVFKMKELISRDPGRMNVIATMNAGHIPSDSWVQDPEVGGGRIIGEACHLIDLISYLCDSKVVEVSMMAMGNNPALNTDNVSIHLHYKNGSLGVINYFANGHKSYSKERVEVYHQGKNLVLDNFRRLDGYGYGKGLGSALLKTKQDKGHSKQFELLFEQWKMGGKPLIPFDEIVNTTQASFAAIESLKLGKFIKI